MFMADVCKGINVEGWVFSLERKVVCKIIIQFRAIN